ncbi:hypothetical protein [Actinoplanes sp. NPDC020271]|uniref:hypothetical protein n=1 Tax=Actinoplanes sp. NPDC020271 TaxID=3363896 RepID=UPI00378C90D5
MDLSNLSGVFSNPQALLHDIQWADFNHALGSAQDVPEFLIQLLAKDPVEVARALRHLEQTVHHQNTIYSATGPVALYVAAILSDARVGTIGVYRPNDVARPLRAVLLDWLAEMADDASDSAAEAMRRHGFAPLEDRPEVLKFRAFRPAICEAIVPFLDDPDPLVRCAAVIAMTYLLDSNEVIHSLGLLPRIQEVIQISSNQHYLIRAAELISDDIYDRPNPPSDGEVPF